MKNNKLIIMAVLGLILALAGAVYAGWRESISATFTGTTYSYTNSSGGNLDVDAVWVRFDAAADDTVSVYRVDSDANLFLLEQGSSNALQYVVVTPRGGGKIVLSNTDILRVIRGTTNQADIIIDITKPE